MMILAIRVEAGELGDQFRRTQHRSDDEVHATFFPSILHKPYYVQREYLACCIRHSRLELLRRALEVGLDPNLPPYDDIIQHQSLIHYACFNRWSSIEVLIQYGADVNVLDREKRTPMDHVGYHEAATLLLLKHGGKSVNPLDPYQRRWIVRVERTMQLLHGAPLPKDIIRHIYGFIQ